MSAKLVFIEAQCTDQTILDEDGLFSICFSEDEAIALNKQYSNFAEIEKLVSDFSYSFTKKITRDQRQVLAETIYSLRSDNLKQYKVQLLDKGIDVLTGVLCVSDIIDNPKSKTSTVTFQLLSSHQEWKDGSKECTMCDLDLGERSMTPDDIKDEWENTKCYEDGAPAAIPFLANKGGLWSSTGEGILVPELSLGVWNLAIWRAFFCKMGYELCSEFLTKKSYRRELTYVSKQSEVDTNCLFNLQNTFVETGSNKVDMLDLQEQNSSNFNNEGCYDITNGFQADGLYQYCGTLNLKTVIPAGQAQEVSARIKFEIVKECNGVEEILFSHSGGAQYYDPYDYYPSGLNPQVSEREDIEIKTELCLISSGCRVFARYETQKDADATYTMALNLYNQGQTFLYSKDEQIVIAEKLDCNCNLYDWILDEKKLYNLQFKTDPVSRKVYVEPEKASIDQITGELCDGFIKSNSEAIDITPYIDHNFEISKSFRSKTSNIKGYSFEYNEGDELVKQKEEQQGIKIYGKEIICNPKAETITPIKLKKAVATCNRIDNTIPRASYASGGQTDGLYIPHFWPNSINEETNRPDYTNETGVRRLRWFCCGKLEGQNIGESEIIDGIGYSYYWDFEGSRCAKYPLVGQHMEFPIDLGNGPVTDNSTNAFALNDTNGLFYLHHYSSIKEDYQAAKIKITTCLTSYLYKCIDIQKLIVVNSSNPTVERYNGYYRLERAAKEVCKQKTVLDLCSVTPVEPLCPEDVIVDPCSQNDLGLECTGNDPYNIAITGTSSNTITNTTFEINYLDETNGWQTSHPTLSATSNSATVSNPESRFRVRVKIERDGGCPPFYLYTPIKNPCGNNFPQFNKIASINQDGETCFQLFIGGNLEDDYTIEEFYYTLPSSQAQVPYNEGDVICVQEEATFFAVLQFNNNCPPIEVGPEVCPVPPVTTNCESDALPECICDASGCKTFTYTGTFGFQARPIQYWFRCLDLGETEFRMWDGITPICCDEIEMFLMAFDCMGNCDPYCSPVVSCTCDEECECSYTPKCIACIGSVDHECSGYTFTWYKITDANDIMTQPTMTAQDVISNYSIFAIGDSGIQLPHQDEEDCWFAVIGSKEGCDDKIEYTFNDIGEAGTVNPDIIRT